MNILATGLFCRNVSISFDIYPGNGMWSNVVLIKGVLLIMLSQLALINCTNILVYTKE